MYVYSSESKHNFICDFILHRFAVTRAKFVQVSIGLAILYFINGFDRDIEGRMCAIHEIWNVMSKY